MPTHRLDYLDTCNIWFTADLHLGHKRIIDVCNRPFASADEMDAGLIGNINSCVGRNDRLYIIGDFSMGSPSAIEAYCKRINCRDTWLIPGNHDHPKAHNAFCQNVRLDILRLRVADKPLIVLCHFPILAWDCVRHGAIHLHGHSHGSLESWKKEHMPGAAIWDVGVDCMGYRPVNLKTILEKNDERLSVFGTKHEYDGRF